MSLAAGVIASAIQSQSQIAGGGGGGAFGSHRYWRLTDWVTIDNGGLMEVSEIRLFAGASDVSAGTTYSGSALQGFSFPTWNDGSLVTRAYWNTTAGTLFTNLLNIDLGSAQPVDGVKIGGFDTSGRFTKSFRLLYSDDESSYTPAGTCPDQTYPGDNTLGPLITSFT